jgi:hypothetical protein
MSPCFEGKTNSNTTGDSSVSCYDFEFKNKNLTSVCTTNSTSLLSNLVIDLSIAELLGKLAKAVVNMRVRKPNKIFFSSLYAK